VTTFTTINIKDCLTCSTVRASVRHTRILKEPTYALGCIIVILLQSRQGRVSATHVAIFRVVITIIQIQL